MIAPHRKKQWILALILFAIIVAVGPATCYLVMTPLVVRDQIDRADAIVVLNGNTEERVRHGVEVYSEGRAAVLIMSGGNMIRGVPESHLMKDVAVRLGVPPAAILTEEKSNTTITNARYSAELIRQQGYHSIILVTSPYHSRRATRMFRDTLGPDVSVYSQPVTNSSVNLEHWWLHPQTRRTVFSESIQLFWWILQHPRRLAAMGLVSRSALCS